MGTGYIFIDESGDTFHSDKSSNHFMLHGMVVNNFDNHVLGEILKLRLEIHDDENKKLTKFHASEDKQAIRDRMFEIINKLDYLKDNFVFSVILDKRKGYNRVNCFNTHHQNACKWLIGGALHDLTGWDDDELIICFDSMPSANNKSKSLMIKGLKIAIADFFREKKFTGNIKVFHQESAQNPYLQIIDYIGRAIYKKYEKDDSRSFDLISKYIINIFSPFTRKSDYPSKGLRKNKKTPPEETSS